MSGSECLSEDLRGMAGGFAAVFGGLIGGEEELFDVNGGQFSGDVRTKFGNGEIGHEADETGNGGGVGSATERDDKAAGMAFAQVVEEA